MKTRLTEGSNYYFIRISKMRIVQTADVHFDSDNERYAAKNYFYSKTTAQACLNAILGKHGDDLEALNDEMERATGAALRDFASLASRAKKGTEDPGLILKDVIRLQSAFETRKRTIYENRKVIMDAIKALITKYSQKEK